MTGLVKKVDAFVRDNKKSEARAVVVLVAKDSDEIRAKLKKLAKDEKLEIPLTISADPKATEKTNKLDDKVKDTVIVYRNKKVAANFALNEIKDKDIEAILAAAKDNAAATKT